MTAVAALVLAGGGARRFGGDKLGAPLHGRPVLDHLLIGLPAQWQVVCVGPRRATPRPVRWVREEPPGGGPVAAIAAGAAVVEAGVEMVIVLAGDMPEGGALAGLLVASAEHSDGRPGSGEPAAAWVAVGSDGRPNPLAACFRRSVLSSQLPRDPDGVAARRLLSGLAVEHVSVADELLADIDTPADMQRHSARAPGPKQPDG
ncbi:MAG: NTP transferase domain-containing protein [Nostocoides sp.]